MLLLLLLSRFSRVRLCATPEMAAHQAPLSLGFSRQEHWSGLPFPSAMHESEKWKWSRSVVSDSSQPHGLQPTRLFRPWDFPGKSTWSGVPLPSPIGMLPSSKISFKKCDWFLFLSFSRYPDWHHMTLSYVAGIEGNSLNLLIVKMSTDATVYWIN